MIGVPGIVEALANRPDDGGPAFPQPFVFEPDKGACGVYTPSVDIGHGGMTLREWFAGKATVEAFVIERLSGSQASWEALDGGSLCPMTQWAKMNDSERFHAAVVYHKLKQADAMIAALKARKP